MGVSHHFSSKYYETMIWAVLGLYLFANNKQLFFQFSEKK